MIYVGGIREEEMRIPFVFAMVLAAGWSLSAFAAGGTGTLKGLITDPAGAHIGGATIVVHRARADGSKPVAIFKQARADSQGRYSADLPPGSYRVCVSSPGFSQACENMHIKQGVTSVLDKHLKLDLQVGGDEFPGGSPAVPLEGSSKPSGQPRH